MRWKALWRGSASVARDGAEERTRTSTPLRASAPQADASAIPPLPQVVGIHPRSNAMGGEESARLTLRPARSRPLRFYCCGAGAGAGVVGAGCPGAVPSAGVAPAAGAVVAAGAAAGAAGGGVLPETTDDPPRFP